MMPRNRITIIGVGRLGLCLALCLERAGYEVLGVDIDEERVTKINKKMLDSPEPRVTEFLKNSIRFSATTSLLTGLLFSPLIFIALPTQSSLHSFFHSIREVNILGRHFAICTTLFPEAISLLPQQEENTISCTPFFVIRENLMQSLLQPDLLLIGEGTPIAGALIESIYQTVWPHLKIVKMTPESVEIARLAINSFTRMRIAFYSLIEEISDEVPGAEREKILGLIKGDQRRRLDALQPDILRDHKALIALSLSVGLNPSLLKGADGEHEKRGARHFLQHNDCKSSKFSHCGKKIVTLDTEGVIVKVQRDYLDLFDDSTENAGAERANG